MGIYLNGEHLEAQGKARSLVKHYDAATLRLDEIPSTYLEFRKQTGLDLELVIVIENGAPEDRRRTVRSRTGAHRLHRGSDLGGRSEGSQASCWRQEGSFAVRGVLPRWV